MPEIRARLFQSDTDATWTQKSTRYDQGVAKRISESTALLNFESNGLKQKTPLGAAPMSRSGHSDSPKCYQLRTAPSWLSAAPQDAGATCNGGDTFGDSL